MDGGYLGATARFPPRADATTYLVVLALETVYPLLTNKYLKVFKSPEIVVGPYSIFIKWIDISSNNITKLFKPNL